MLDLLKRRGPDSVKVVRRTCRNTNSIKSVTLESPVQTLHLVFVSTVLSVRGKAIVEQPLIDRTSGSLLCWNGEAWKLGREPITGNDAQAVFNALLNTKQTSSPGQEIQPSERKSRVQEVLGIIGILSGPYSFVFYDALSQQVFYGRDIIGRRSLLYRSSSPREFILSSISDWPASEDWIEVEACGIQIIDLSAALASAECDRPSIPAATEGFPFIKTILWSAVERNRSDFPSSECIESLDSQQDMWGVAARNRFPMINRETSPPAFQGLCLDSEVVDSLHEQLRASLILRMQGAPHSPVNASQNHLAILFSGGLDCTVLARLVHDILPLEHSIDLLNVAFENPRVMAAANATAAHNEQNADSATSPYDKCPDRLTGISTYGELLNACPGRVWRFVSVDVPYSETLAHRSQVISLIHPHNTEMDLSIACALYFAARGIGNLSEPEGKCKTLYTTPARVLVSGLGADELFAGYSRHAIAFARNGHDGVLDELELDFLRLGKRNLGRDDRVISHWGKEARYPYLDESVVRWALERPLHEKCNFRRDGSLNGTALNYQPMLEPDKHVLRLLAWKLGMPGAAMEKKRAIQFGSRTAKMVVGRSRGTQILETATV